MFHNQWVRMTFSAEGFYPECCDDSAWRKNQMRKGVDGVARRVPGVYSIIERKGTRFKVTNYSDWTEVACKYFQTGIEALDFANFFLQ